MERPIESAWDRRSRTAHSLWRFSAGLWI